MTRIAFVAMALVVFLGLLAHDGVAGGLDTVAWAPDATDDGLGSGTLAGGTVTYSTAAAAQGNSGETLYDNWNTSLATAGLNVNNLVAGTLGEMANSPQDQTIEFTKTVINPILLINYADADVTFNFGVAPITLLSSYNASLSGDVVTFNGATNSVNDGFAAQLTGTYGPGQALIFLATSTGNESQTFTIGEAVPEPSSLVLAGAGVVFLAGMTRRRKAR